MDGAMVNALFTHSFKTRKGVKFQNYLKVFLGLFYEYPLSNERLYMLRQN